MGYHLQAARGVGSMRERVRKSRYIAAFIITALIFFFGFLLGYSFKNMRGDALDNALNEQNIEYSNLLLQYQYISELEEEENCAFLNNVFQESLQRLNLNSELLQTYGNQKKLKQDDYSKLRQQYTISQIDYWLLARKLKNSCNLDYSIILYFFNDEENCPSCEDQGIHLDYVKRKLQDDVLIFALDGSEEGIVSLLKTNYDVVDYPTLIINERKFGFTHNQGILAESCRGKETEACA